MKNIITEFFRRGLMSFGFGPLVLAAIYLFLQCNGIAEMLSASEVCLGILSLSVLAFVAGGMNVIYQVERLPLMVAILIHGAVLYIAYLTTYLVNNWLAWSATPILVFSGIFILGYFVIWAIIYSIIKRNTCKVNELLKQKQQRG